MAPEPAEAVPLIAAEGRDAAVDGHAESSSQVAQEKGNETQSAPKIQEGPFQTINGDFDVAHMFG